MLEDTNIKGAKGILVNVTAGPDLSIGEFGEVGGMIRDMASEDATVVIGTSIDADMKDALRVTMVATGIQGEGSESERPRSVAVVPPVAKAVGSEIGGAGAYENSDPLDGDGSLLSGGRRSGHSELPLFDADGDSSLDIPTILRRQAD